MSKSAKNSSNNNKTQTIEDCTRTIDEPDDNGKSTATLKSKKSQRRRKPPPPAPAPPPPRPQPSKEDTKNDTTDTRSSNTSTNRSTSSRTSEKDDNAKAAAASSAVPPHQRSRVKRFFLKISEKMGGVEQTQYSETFTETCTDIDNYKLAIEDVTLNLIRMTQRNSRLIQAPLKNMNFEYTSAENPFELLQLALKDFGDRLPAGANEVAKYAEVDAKLAELHRSFHRRVRRSLRHIKGFLEKEYNEFCNCRKVLNERRQDMDFAKHELKNAKSPEIVEMKNIVYENAQKNFESQLQRVLASLEKFPTWKEEHIKDLQSFQCIYRVFHEQMAEIIAAK